jgi:hypothetical protein
MSKKILVLGLGQNNFLSYLYATLKKYNNEFYISAPFYTDLNSTNKDESWMYNNETIKSDKSILMILKSTFLSLFSLHFYQTFFFICFVEKKFNKSLHFISQQILAKAYFLNNNNFKSYDTFHFHFMQYSYLRELFLVPRNKKIVCSFWGSDLLRTSDILNFYIVKKALKKASVITCQSAELREIILSKFGRELFEKIEINIFPVDSITYNQMDLMIDNHQEINAFKNEYGYSTDKFNVLIGHNGSPFNNHLAIIKAIHKSIYAEKIHLIINLNYGLSHREKASYKKKLIKALFESPFTYTIIEHFFSKEELALSRLSTDVFIHLPISDALSGSMLEMLYASCSVITGSWLPYKTFTNAKLVYHEVNDFTMIADKMDFILNNFEAEKQKIKENKTNVKNHFLTDAIIKKWNIILN